MLRSLRGASTQPPAPARRPVGRQESWGPALLLFIWVTLWNISSCYSPCLVLRAASAPSPSCSEGRLLACLPSCRLALTPQCVMSTASLPELPRQRLSLVQDHFEAPPFSVHLSLSLLPPSLSLSPPPSMVCLTAPQSPLPRVSCSVAAAAAAPSPLCLLLLPKGMDLGS